MFDVFLSYRRSDGAQIVRSISDYLSEKGLHVFLDEREMHDSQKFTQQLESALEEAPHYIFLATPDALKFREGEDWVLREITRARELYDMDPEGRTFGPVCLQRMDSTLLATLPETVQNAFWDIQWIQDNSMEKLLTRILKSVT